MKTHAHSGRLHGHSTMALEKRGPHLPMPESGGPHTFSLGVPSQHPHGDPRSAGGREDAGEGMTGYQTLPDSEATAKRREQQVADLEAGRNLLGYTQHNEGY